MKIFYSNIRWLKSCGNNILQGAKLQPQHAANLKLAIKAVRRSHYFLQIGNANTAPSGKVKDGEGIVCAEEQSMVHFRMMAKQK